MKSKNYCVLYKLNNIYYFLIMSFTLQTKCRICDDTNLIDILDLGSQSLTSIFPKLDEPSPVFAPQALIKCTNCGLLQMKHTVNAENLYTDNYGYRSGLNGTMISHLSKIVEQIEYIVQFEDNDIVVDIGANDATLLSKYCDRITKIAIDPCGEQFKEYYPSNVRLIPEFFSKDTYNKNVGIKKAKVVTSISMFYDLPHPQQFTNDVAEILHEDGIWLMEQSYMPTMIDRLSFDTICHEHLEYYSLKQIEYMADRAGLKVIDMSLNDCNGGSFRVILCHKENTCYNVNTQQLDEYRKWEIEWNASDPYTRFKAQIEIQKTALMNFLKQQKSNGKTIAIYGASTKGNTLLQYYGIDKDLITCVAERNPRKFGHKTPGTEIPIKCEEDVRNMKPDYMLVLPWHFKDEFLVRETTYLENGGTFIFPLPHMDIVSYDPRRIALVIGSTGQIGSHLVSLLISKGYNVFTMSRNEENLSLVTHIPCDISNYGILDCYIRSIKPDEIYNLAAITDNHESINNPVQTMNLNATSVFQILESIKNTNTKFFNMGSIEMFKGLDKDVIGINESDIDKLCPKTPYAIAKQSAFWAVKNNRDLYGTYCVTGICTNVESKMRRASYVTKKVINYFKQGKYDIPLEIGNSDVYCDWIYIGDVINSMYTIMQQHKPSDYIIGCGHVYSLREFIYEVANYVGIKCKWVDNNLIDLETMYES